MNLYVTIPWPSSALLLLLLLGACQSSKDLPVAEAEVEYITLDTVTITPDSGPSEIPYRSSAARSWDLLKTALDIELLWDSRSVKGQALLSMKPLFYPSNSIQLDAKDMRIDGISMDKQNVSFEYNDSILVIHLPREYRRDEILQLRIQYEAFPYRDLDVGYGSRGIYFVGEGEEFGQVWTQGETEYNSRWFPTIDKPNERCQQETRITVPEGIQCLSNGVLFQRKTANGKTTYHYSLEEEHAPYLFMLAAGHFHVEQGQWGDVPLAYWVDTAYAQDASRIFNHTPEMLSFFSAIYDYPYPWPKYDQAVVKEFVSGAMENTTAVLFGDFVQNVTGELIDNSNDYIVAHEMAHHWFGDLTTCESWAHLTLNEGFANYAEYLWMEHKYGLEQAEWYRISERQGYLEEYYSGRRRALIDYHYSDKEDMFDAHSYNKGSLILHMLRHHIGDEAFFTSIHTFLDKHAYSSVEADDLRLAIEEVTGLDLRPFFEQWYFSAGHPILEMSYVLKDSAVRVTVTQEQEEPFEFPLDLWIIGKDGKKKSLSRKIHKRTQTLNIALDFVPQLMLVDPYRALLAEWETPYDSEDALLLLQADAPLQWRYRAVELLQSDSTIDIAKWIDLAMADSHWSIREKALASALSHPQTVSAMHVGQLLQADNNSQVRTLAAQWIAKNVSSSEASTLLLQQLESDSSHLVLSQCLMLLYGINPTIAEPYAQKFKSQRGTQLPYAAAFTFAGYPQLRDSSFMMNFFLRSHSSDRQEFAGPLTQYILGLQAQDHEVEPLVKTITREAQEASTLWDRFASGYTIYSLAISAPEGSKDQYKEIFEEIKATEATEYLRGLYESFSF